METKDWDDLKQLAQSENPHERVSAVIKARVRTDPFMDGTLMEDGLRKAVNLSHSVFHSGYNPTVEEAVVAVRNFFERWGKRTDEKQYWGEIIDLARSEKADERKEAVFRSLEEVRVLADGLHLYSDAVRTYGNLKQALNDLSGLCHIPPPAEEGKIFEGHVVILYGTQQFDYVPTQEEAMVIVEKCRQFKKTFGDFAKRHRKVK